MKRKYTLGLLFISTCCTIAISRAQSSMPEPVFPKNGSSSAFPLSKTSTTDTRLAAVSRYGYFKTKGYYFNDSNMLGWQGTMMPDYEATPLPIYTYQNAETNLLSVNNSGMVSPETKTLNTYNRALQIKTTLVLNWNAAAGTWDSAARTRNTYYADNITESVNEVFDSPSGTWAGRLNTIYDYSAAVLTDITIQASTGLTTAWTNSKHTRFDYTGTELTARTEQDWYTDPAGSYWLNREKILYSYTGMDTTAKIVQQWNPAAAAWQNGLRFRYDYAGGPFPDEYIDVWNKTVPAWNKYRKNDVTYTAGTLTGYLEQTWDRSIHDWATQFVHFYDYAGGPYITLYGKQYWDGTKWFTDFIQEYKYNSDNQLIRSNYYDWDGIEFIDIEADNVRTNYYYELIPTVSIRQAATGIRDVSLFPNPATAALTYLAYATTGNTPTGIVLTDLSGRQLWHTAEQGTTGDHLVPVPLADLPAGMYLLQVIPEGGTAVHTLKLARL